MLRVVLDTNIYASAFTSTTGPTFRIWQAVLDRRFHLLISPALVAFLAVEMRLLLIFSRGDFVILLREVESSSI